MVLAELPMVELVEVDEGVREPFDHLGTHTWFSFTNETYFKLSFLDKDNLLVLHLEVDFEGALEVLSRKNDM